LPEYLAPGVYMEEFSSGAKPIEGVSTSTVGFLGETQRGPLKPRLITSFADFQRVFGGYLNKEVYLPYAIDGFFRNGGKRCFVARIVNKEQFKKSNANGFFLAPDKDSATMNVEVQASGPGLWAKKIKVKVESGSQRTNQHQDLFRLVVTSDSGEILEVIDNISANESSSFSYKNSVNGISNYVELKKLKTFPTQSATRHPGTNDKIKDFEKLVGATAKKIKIKNDPTKDALEIKKGTPPTDVKEIWFSIRNSSSGDPEQFDLLLKGYEANQNFVGDNSPAPFFEHHKNLSNSGTEPYKSINDQAEKLVQVDKKIDGRPVNNSTFLQVDLGWDGSDPNTDDITASDYEGSTVDIEDENGNVIESIHTGLEGLSKVDDISIVSAPDEVIIDSLTPKIITHCENLKDRFAIIQAKRKDAIPNNIGNLQPDRESQYAALYMPWFKILDPLTNTQKLIPPGGHIAGIYARSDIERGVHKAPANEVVRGATALQTPIDKGVQDVLNPRGINVIRSFPGRGIILWGARTISTDPDWKYVNVRRLFIFIEKSIERATQWVVFEPNNERLWSRIIATITQFLTGVWRTGALMGTTAEEGFFVKCDRSTMTQDDIDNGRLVCIIGIAPTKPAEFVIFRLTQTKAGSSFEEI